MSSVTVLGWHVALQFQPLLSLKHPRAMKCDSRQKGAGPACDSAVSHFKETFLGLSVDIGEAAHG